MNSRHRYNELHVKYTRYCKCKRCKRYKNAVVVEKKNTRKAFGHVVYELYYLLKNFVFRYTYSTQSKYAVPTASELHAYKTLWRLHKVINSWFKLIVHPIILCSRFWIFLLPYAMCSPALSCCRVTRWHEPIVAVMCDVQMPVNAIDILADWSNS